MPTSPAATCHPVRVSDRGAYPQWRLVCPLPARTDAPGQHGAAVRRQELAAGICVGYSGRVVFQGAGR